MPNSPYKFLDYYRLEDEKIFKGRDRETQTLVSDIVTKRIVVLFAKTGTGKTSLINAGVRPKLHERAYETSYIRVSSDPAESARRVMARQFKLDLAAGTLSPQQLEALVERLEKPLVLFFDQFEEFFIYVGGRSEQGRRFISDVASLYQNKMSGVHLVFSMREEFLYEMDHFRDAIPTIFHMDSTLRLRGFDRDQARDAIQLPAAQVSCEVTDTLAERLLTDLAKTSQAARYGEEEIEPTQLQIVCDALWQKRAGDKITLDDYRRLGREGGDPNIARQILDRRIEEVFESIAGDDQLRLAELLLPELRTDDDTKRVREFDDLVKGLGTSRELLDKLITQLEGARLVRKDKRESTVLVELSHDYLADARRIGLWQKKIRSLWLQRMKGRQEVLSSADLGRVLENPGGWALNREQASFLFRSALAHGLDMRQYFELALDNNVGVWDTLRDTVNSPDTNEAMNAIDLLRELHTPQAVQLLEAALARVELAAEAQAALAVAARSRNSEVSSRATLVLRRLGPHGPGDQPPQRHASTDRGPQGHVGEAPGRLSFDPPYRLIRDQLMAGRVIPYFGPGASLSGRRPDEAWSEQRRDLLPTGQELARYLAEMADFPQGEPLELPKVSQYLTMVSGRRVLDEELRRVFDHDYQPAAPHKFLAEIGTPLLIVTTNFDNLIERAFDNAGRLYDLVIQTSDPKAGESILWRRRGESDFVSVAPDRLDIDLHSAPVVYKMLGSANSSGGEPGHYIITEDDYVDYLTQMSRNRAIPALFAELFQTLPFLFLGYRLGDWTQRLILNRIERDLRRSKRVPSWAVQPSATPLERRFWRERRVELYEMEIEEFISRLAAEGRTDV